MGLQPGQPFLFLVPRLAVALKLGAIWTVWTSRKGAVMLGPWL